jgi:non-specific serine/threonine protein kinase
VGENPLLIASKAYVYWQYYNAGIRPDPEYLTKAWDLADRLARVDPASHYVDLIRGLVEAHQGQLAASVGRLRRALSKDPNDVDALTWLVVMLNMAGRSDEALALAMRLHNLDPLNWMARLGPLASEYYLGRIDRAVDLARKLPPEDLEIVISAFVVVQVYAQAGDIAEAAAQADAMTARNPDEPFGRLAQLLMHALGGRGDEARRGLTADLVEMARADMQYSAWVADILAAAGGADQALEWLEHAVARGFLNYPFLATHDRLLAPIRDVPRFKALLDDLRPKWEAFASAEPA